METIVSAEPEAPLDAHATYEIPAHDRPGGGQCGWSGVRTINPGRLCPDRCPQTGGDRP